MRAMLKAIFAFLLVLGIVFSPVYSGVAARGSNVVLYWVPHADDETLSYAAAIEQDIEAGKQVYLFLLSGGEQSSARDVVNGEFDDESISGQAGQKVYCKIHQRYHDPVAEHYDVGHMSKEEFIEKRVDEFHRAADRLGVPRSHQFVYYLSNENFDHATLMKIMNKWNRVFPGATNKGMSIYDPHPDHRMVGEVMNELAKWGIVRNKKHYASIYMDRFTNKVIAGIRIYPPDTDAANRIEEAVGVYEEWDPEHGHYGLGIHSVPAQFESMKKAPYSKEVIR